MLFPFLSSNREARGRGRAAAGRCSRWGGRCLDGGRAALAGADADGLLARADEDLAVADDPGMGGLLDGLPRALDQVVLQDDLALHLGQAIDAVLGAAVELGVAFLAADALCLGPRAALDSDPSPGFFSNRL